MAHKRNDRISFAWEMCLWAPPRAILWAPPSDLLRIRSIVFEVVDGILAWHCLEVV